jgi:hypothetical protein
MVIVAPLVELGVFVVVLWCIAAALSIALIIRYIGAVFRSVPVVGGYIAGALDSVAQAITSAAGALTHKSEQLLGASFHALARYMDRMWQHLVWSSHVLLQSAEHLLRLTHAHAALRATVHAGAGAIHGIRTRVGTLEGEYTHLRHRVKAVEDRIARGIGNDVRSHVRALEQEVTGLKDRVVPGLRARIKTAEGEISGLRSFVGAVPGTKYLAWAAGIVTAALGLEIMSLLRCPSAKNVSNQRGCSMWNALDDLLGLVALGIVAADFEELVHEAQDLTDVATTVFDDVFGLSR